MNLVEEILAGNRRSLARAITLVENELPGKQEVLKALFPHTGKAYVVGVTGSPGAGKSSLVDRLMAEIRQRGLTVGVIAVDPTSPFSGGALLGDRIRMQEHALDPGVFIRSMGTRGSLGGLARTTKEVIKVLDAAGKDVVLVETVGVGQSELEIMHAADTTVVVLTPGAGDVIQTLKAGIMEIADVFAVNKADLDGATKVVTEVQTMLELDRKREWVPPVVPTVSLTGKGVVDLLDAIQRHRAYLVTSGKLSAKRERRQGSEVLDLVLEQLKKMITEQILQSGEISQAMERVLRREGDPYTAAQEIIKALFAGWQPGDHR